MSWHQGLKDLLLEFHLLTTQMSLPGVPLPKRLRNNHSLAIDIMWGNIKHLTLRAEIAIINSGTPITPDVAFPFSHYNCQLCP